MQVSNLKHNSDREIVDYGKRLNPPHSTKLENDKPQAQSAVSDHVFLNNIRPHQAREFLHNHIGRAVAEQTPKSQAAQPAFTRSFPDAKTTASHIIDTVNQAASSLPEHNADSGNNLKDLINRIQEGFNQAKDALEKLNVLSQGFAPEFDDIHQSVNNFLQFLEDPENNALPVIQSGNGNNLIETSEVSASLESYQSSSQASIQIETRDGDIVTIDLTNSINQQQSSASLQDNRFSGYVYEAFSESENSLAFTVSGELDEDELNAISNLVGDIAKTVGQFEKGNVTAALNIAKNIDTQSDELSGFSFNVQTSEQYRAIDLYQKTQVVTDAGNIPGAPLPAPENGTNTTSANENVNSIFSNNISNHIYAAESANLLEAAATVNSIFEKFYEQLNLLNERVESFIGSDNKEHEEQQAHEEAHS